MKRKFSMNWQNFTPRFSRKQRKYISKIGLGLGFLLSLWLLCTTVTLVGSATKPVGTFFVLGGSITREIYVAKLVKQYPQIPVLVSQGSLPPCILMIFQRENTITNQVWLEECAHSTFDNFYYSVPILRQWGVRKVKVITSPTHLPRAQWMAQIILGSHGIWVEPEIIQEKGVPGNRENWLKTGLDVTRSLIWAILSQVLQPQCQQLTRLSDVNLAQWQSQGFKCEYQGKLGKG
ncbi:YdcF family protein [Calothrix sp. 336/3]|uniref:YdcF family protein n=1 Tax=Calothrix sp. 336/3 TaxID=1337936 RepID=UPI0004E32A4B|nr:YdcF family protein [Calothrix sp. 336/3]AKG24194.1 hypothetical protein IJ00_25345 [Calothrix sp. 336/3]